MGYDAKPMLTCMHCTHYSCDVGLQKWALNENALRIASGRQEKYIIIGYGVETNHRCTLGGFAVKKMATCNKFVKKDSE